MLNKFFIALIRFYQLCISPMLGPHCRFTPTCSQYALEAIRTYGVFKGTILSIKRIAKCHPFHAGGHDPLPQKQLSEKQVQHKIADKT